MRDKQSGQFASTRSTEERMAELGIDFYEISVLRLVVRGYHPDFALKVVERLYGVRVDVRELHKKLTVNSTTPAIALDALK